MNRVLVVFLLGLLLQACSWVALTEQGEKTRVLSAAEVKSCKKLGKTTSISKDKVAGLERDPETLQTELETLARNSAVDLNGDTVVPIGVPVDGKQVYEVYRCINP